MGAIEGRRRERMRAMEIGRIGPMGRNREPLRAVGRPVPMPGPGEVLVRVAACGVCHTELDEIEGRTPPSRLPRIPGHEVVGTVEGLGTGGGAFRVGDRVGVAWIHSACGRCAFCRRGEENLCPAFTATGRDVDGGYAEFMTVPEAYAHPIPGLFSDAEAAPLLCAGAVGYRALSLSGLADGGRLGLAGFGASAHIVLTLVLHRMPTAPVYVLARSGRERAFALELGAAWAGDFGEDPPARLDAIIDTTPVWGPVLEALRCLTPGGRLVINAIRKEDTDREAFLRLDYAAHLWMEKEIKSVANVTARDVREFLEVAAEVPIRPVVEEFALEDANRALMELKERKIRGAKVLRIG